MWNLYWEDMVSQRWILDFVKIQKQPSLMFFVSKQENYITLFS